MAITDKPTALQTDNEVTTSMFESFLTPEEDKVEDAVTETEEVTQEEVIEDESEFVDEEIDQEIADELEDDYEEELDEEQTDVEEEAPQLQTFTVKVDGQEVEVTQEELVNGYSRQQDYTRKHKNSMNRVRLFSNSKQS